MSINFKNKWADQYEEITYRQINNSTDIIFPVSETILMSIVVFDLDQYLLFVHKYSEEYTKKYIW